MTAVKDPSYSADKLDYRVKVLVAISSSGEDPFLSIEQNAQSETFANCGNFDATFLWFEGDPALARRLRFRILNRFVGFLHKSQYSPRFRIAISGGRVHFHISLRRFLARFYSPVRGKNQLSTAISRLAGPPAETTIWNGGRRVRLGLPNSYFLHPLRSRRRFAYLQSVEFDYVLFTTSTCYVDVPNLLSRIEKLPTKGVYAGPKMRFGCSFVPGNHTLMSRDVFDEVAKRAEMLRLDFPDDVGVGLLVEDFGLAEVTEIPTENINPSLAELSDLSHPWNEIYLFRCKAEPHTLHSEPVISLMHKLHGLLISERRKV